MILGTPGHAGNAHRAAQRLRTLAVFLLASALAGSDRAADLFPGALVGAGEAPVAPVVADFNGDGVDDIAIANSGSGDISVALGRGDGSFQPQRRVPAGTEAVALAVADFDGDGRIDLAVADRRGGAAVILPGLGDGGFAAARALAVSPSPSGIVAADFDGDGRIDLAIADAAAQEVVILLGRGDGSFRDPASIDPGTPPRAIAAADMDGDRRTDLVVAGSFRVVVLKGRGDGGFDRVFAGSTATRSVSIAVADFDGDRVPDVALGGDGNGCDDPFLPGLQVLRGLGDGTLVPVTVLDTAIASYFLAAADLDGDHVVDLAASRVECHADGRGTIGFYRGRGDGTFEAPTRSPAGYGPGGLATGDLDGNGATDVVVAGTSANYVSVLLGTGDGRFAPRAQDPPRWAVGDAPAAVVTADFDGDGRPDLATADDWSDDVTVRLADGRGGFGAPVRYAVGPYPQSLITADLNGDGHVDLVADDRILFGLGDGRFTAGPMLAAGYRPLAVAASDLDGDGRPDVVIADAGDFAALTGAVAVFLNAGAGSFLPAGRLEAGQSPVAVLLADLDGDGRTDLISADAWSTELRLFKGQGDGTFAAPEALDAGLGARVILAADIDGDHVPDLIVAGFADPGAGGSVAILHGRGAGVFAPAKTLVAGGAALGLAAGDLDGDGDIDLAAADYEADSISVLLNQGGVFAPQRVYFAGDAPAAVAIVDLDGDGRNDLAVANYQIPGAVSLLFNQGAFPNRSPRAAIAARPAVECESPAGASVTLDGRSSSDPDSTPGTADDIISFEWFDDLGPAGWRPIGQGPVIVATLAPGAHAVVLRVTDRAGLAGTAAAGVRITDTTAPTLALRSSASILWPPNRRMVPVQVAAAARDACGPVTVVLVSATSSEPDDAPGPGDGGTTGDISGAAIGTPDFDLGLRAERDASGPGRTYTLTYRATDAAGNATTATVTILVPVTLRGLPGPTAAGPRNPGRPPKHNL
jgi:hypothetical protein